MTNSLKKRFIKDVGLNINVLDEPYFTQRLIQFTKIPKYRNVLQRYELFVNMIKEEFNNDEGHFFNRLYSVQNEAINRIKENEYYETFCNSPLPKINNLSISNKNLYTIPNSGNKFISIDLVKANFQVFKYNFSRVLDYSDSYKEFIDAHMKDEYSPDFKNYIYESKYLRQVIFGNVNPKRQQSYQKLMMNSILELLLEKNTEFTIDKVYSRTNDEIILDLEDCTKDYIQDIKSCINEYLGYDVRVEYFELVQIGTKAHFYKSCLIEDDIIDIKNVEGFIYPQVLRRLFNESIKEDDKVFFAEKMLARFIGEYDA